MSSSTSSGTRWCLVKFCRNTKPSPFSSYFNFTSFGLHHHLCRNALYPFLKSELNSICTRSTKSITANNCNCGRNRGGCSIVTNSFRASSSRRLEHNLVVDDDDDDVDSLLQILPCDLRDKLSNKSKQAQLLEVVLDVGRLPEAHYLGESGGHYLRGTEVSMKELEYVQDAVGEFGGDNRAGIEGTLHRISAIRSSKGVVVGLTFRVGRALKGCIDMVQDLLQFGESILFVGRPGVGKTTVMREISRVLSDELHKRVVIVDTSNEIGGMGDVPHPSIGGARRLQVPEPPMQHRIMIEAVENHMPEVIIVDEIGTEAEVHACRSIAERGVMLVGTAHGERLENIIKNPTLSDLIGGLDTATLGDQEARIRNSNKNILERKAPPTFPFLIEMRERNYWVAHRTGRSVDMLLNGKQPLVEGSASSFESELLLPDLTIEDYLPPDCWWFGQEKQVRRRDSQFKVVIERWKRAD